MEKIREKLEKVVGRLYGEKIKPTMMVAPEETGADYATNVAMQLAKVARKNPLLIAEEIREALINEGKCSEFELSVAAPGFLNFRLKDDFFARGAKELVEVLASEKSYDKDNENSAPIIDFLKSEWHGKMVVAEFSDPNPFKVLHVGHLYTSVVGDAISRLFEVAGARVRRVNFGGDVGLHVGKTLYALWKKWMEKTAKSASDFESFLQNLTIEQIAKCYVVGTAAYENDEEAKAEIKRINRLVYRISEMGRADGEALTGDDASLAQIYWRGRELSYVYFEDFYRQIGVHFDKFYPESSVVSKGLEEVRAHVGQVYEKSEEAIVYRGEKKNLHTRVFINREGVPTYETKDVGLIFTKWQDWHFDKSVVITGNEQKDYMNVVLASVAEYAPELVERTSHLTHGLVKLKGGVKMSSRKGNFLKAVDVMEMVRTAFAERDSEVVQAEDVDVDEKIVLAALKYAFLRYKMGGEIIFDPQESVSMSGNSGVYLLYSAVRAKKILRKLQQGKQVQLDRDEDGDTEAERQAERALNKKLIQYVEVLQAAVREMTPHLICTYLYELAQEFSRFYERVPVAGSAREAERVKILRAFLAVMEHGLEKVLGIEIPEEM